MVANGIMPPLYKGLVRVEPRPGGEKKNDPSTPVNINAVLQSDADLKTLLYTPIEINGLRFPRCLVDIGSEVNLISVKDSTKYGFLWTPDGIQSIQRIC